MNNIIKLLKIDFLQSLNSFKYKPKSDNKKFIKNILLALFLTISLMPMYIMIIVGLWNGYDIFKFLNQELAFLQLGIVATQILLFIFAIPTVLDKYYFSKDIEILIPLPLKPYEILGGKFLSLLSREYIVSSLVIFPFIIVSGIKSTAGFAYWIYSIFLIIAMPIIPLVIVSIIVMIFMRITNFGKKKDFIRGIGLFLVSISSIVFMFLIQNISDSAMTNEADFMAIIVDNLNKLMSRYGKFFPMSAFGSKGLYNYGEISGLVNIIIFIIISIIGVIFILGLSQKIYFNNFLEGKSGNVSKTKKNKDCSIKIYKQYSPYMAIAKNELITLFKTPIYLFNSVAGVLMMPVILIISFSFGSNKEIFNLLRDNANELKPIIFMVLVAVSLFLNVGTVASTSFSREGKSFWIQKHLPIRGRDQAIGRSLSAFLINAMGIIMIVGIGNYIINLNILDNFIIIFLSILLTMPIIGIALFVDISRPKLNWTSPEQAMKQNTNVLIVMGIVFIYILILVVSTIFLYKIVNIGFIISILSILGFALSYFIYKALISKIEKVMIS